MKILSINITGNIHKIVLINKNLISDLLIICHYFLITQKKNILEKPAPFFEAASPYEYWPGHGFIHNNVLYVILDKIHRLTEWFTINGTDCAIIKNY